MDTPSGFRIHGNAPCSLVVVHGGPGAAGSLEPLAQRLSAHVPVLEPFCLERTLGGQLEKLARCIRQHATLPAPVLGHSFGAMLILLLAARRPELVSRLILVGCGPLEEHPARSIMSTRLGRLSTEQQAAFQDLLQDMSWGKTPDHERHRQLSSLLETTDSYSLLPENTDNCPPDTAVFKSVWPEMARLRASGELLEQASRITCPVLALHGEHDPHPADAVFGPLSARIPDFTQALLPRCGHDPWRERYAHDRFLKEVLGQATLPA